MAVATGGAAAAGERPRPVPRLVGRADELATLTRAVTGPPAVVVLEGEPGIGKTRLVAELAARPELVGRLVTGGCRRIRDPFPLGPVLDVVRELVTTTAPATLSPVVGVLRPLLPEVAGLLPPALPPTDPASHRHRVFRALAELLAAAGPVTVVLEDLHWADAQTVELLHYLLAEPPPALSIVVTYRSDDAGEEVRSLTARMPPGVGHTHLALPLLDERQTAAMAAEVLAVAEVPARFATRLHARSGGLPFAIEQLLALLRERGALPDRDGRVGPALEALDGLAVPYPIRAFVRERVSRLPAGARPVLEAAAVLARPAPEWLLAAVAEAPAPAVAESLGLGVEAGLLADEPPGRVGFRHVLAAQAVYDSIPGPRRRARHAAAAAAIATRPPESGPAPAAPPLGEIAHHLRHSGQQERWAETAERAAAQAVALGHDDEAVRLLEDVLEHAPLGTGARGRMAVALGEAAARTLRPVRRAIEVLTAVLAEAAPSPGREVAPPGREAASPDREAAPPDLVRAPLADRDAAHRRGSAAPAEWLPPAVRGELRLRLAMLLEHSGAEFRRGRDLCAAAVPDLAERPDLQAHAMVVLGVPGVPGIDHAEHQRWLARVLELLPAIGDAGFRLGLVGKVAMVRVMIGDRQWRELVDRIVTETGGEPGSLTEVGGFHSVGEAACYAGHAATAGRLLPAALAGAVANDNRWRELWLRGTGSLLDYVRGDWQGLADRAGALAGQLADHAPGRADVEVVTACLALARGDLDSAQEALTGIVSRLEHRASRDLLPVPVTALVRLAAGRGDHGCARAVAGRFVAGVESLPFVVSAVRALPAVTEALLAAGRRTEAERVVRRWAGALRGRDAPLAPAALRHARGLLAAAAGEPGAAGQLERAADAYATLGCRYEAAQARERAGVALLDGGDARAGAAALRAALTGYQRLGGATWDLDRASQVARRRRISVPARHRGGHRGYGSTLSPRERQVADLAAAGRTNKEIAAELFLSPETVKSQLQSAMRKLEVHTRTALSHRLRAHDRAGAGGGDTPV